LWIVIDADHQLPVSAFNTSKLGVNLNNI
jgi:hypothetical protein